MTHLVKFKPGPLGEGAGRMAVNWGRMSLAVFLVLWGCGPSTTKVEGTGTPPSVTGGCTGGPSVASMAILPENPRTASGNPALPFGSAVSSSWAVGVSLSGLRGNCLVDTGAFRVLSDDFYPASVAVANSTNLVYSPDRPEFRQLASVWWASSVKQAVSALGADFSSFSPVELIAHCAVQGNAYFSPTYREICFGYKSLGGGKYVWAADDGDVVVHETGHALNHDLAGTNPLNSTGEAGALDEAIADYWALTYFGNSKLGEWFLGAIGANLVRDANSVHAYPESMAYEVHDDSRVITEVLWELRKDTRLGKSTTDRMVRLAMELMPATVRFQEFYLALETASGLLNLSATGLNHLRSVFAAKGIHRTDSAAGLRLAAAQPLRVIDDHSISLQAGGNCNGQLDVGETALVLLNLENPQAVSLGTVVATLRAPFPAGVEIPSYGSWGEYFKFQPTQTFLDALATTSGSARDDAVLGAAFLVKAASAGAKNFTVTLRPMNTGLTLPAGSALDVDLSFSLNVGTVATKDDCLDASLWP